jgi:hypothetical protein
MFFNLSILVALILAAIAIYRFSRPAKPLVIFHHGGVLSQDACERLGRSMKHTCDGLGIAGILTHGELTAQPCQSHHVVNIHSHGLDEAGVKAVIEKHSEFFYKAFAKKIEKAQRL